jgi:TPR repeat protein
MRWLSLVALAALFSGAAQAQFYDLDGAYRCVTAPDAACTAAEATPPAPPQPTAKDQEKAKEAVVPSFPDVVERVKKRAPEPADIRLLQQRADAKDPRALEVLAWCNLNGIGMKPDPLAAYLLYRDAAALGVPNARKNQNAIYERMNSDERQQVLLKQDAHQ